jgi:tripeptide aminopeptidase
MPTRAEALTADTFHALRDARAVLTQSSETILESQIAVTRIAAPTGNEHARAEWIAARFREIGLRTALDAVGNVVARTASGGDERAVAVCAHLDTVFAADDPVDVRRAGSRVEGPGITDNARGLAVMLAVAQSIATWPLRLARPVEFVATTGEEGAGDLRGAKHYLESRPRPFVFIALDGAGDEQVVTTAIGSRRFRITYRGPGGHSWSAFGVANPVHAAARTATLLADRRLASGAPSALSVSRIGGGLSVNSIPTEAWLEVDARSTSDSVLERIEAAVREIVWTCASQENAQRRPQTASLTYTIDRIGCRAGGVVAEDVPLVVTARAATRLVGRTPTLASASTDANAAIAAGVPAIAIGGGGAAGGAHSPTEWFDNASADVGVERALTIVATAARLAAD